MQDGDLPIHNAIRRGMHEVVSKILDAQQPSTKKNEMLLHENKVCRWCMHQSAW